MLRADDERLAFDEGRRKRSRGKFPGAARLEPLDIDAAGQIKQFSSGKPCTRKVSAAVSERTTSKSARSYLRGNVAIEEQNLPSIADASAGAETGAAAGCSRGTLPRSRCQVGISMIEGIPSLRVTRSDCRHHPTNCETIVAAVASWRAAIQSR